MPFARAYTLAEVEEILFRSEGRIVEGFGRPGHTLSEHLRLSNDQLVAKSERMYTSRQRYDPLLAMFSWSTAFMHLADAVAVTHAILNAPTGQARLQSLDDRWPDREPEAWEGIFPDPVWVRHSAVQTVRKALVDSAYIVVAPLPLEVLHVHTCFPLLGRARHQDMV